MSTSLTSRSQISFISTRLVPILLFLLLACIGGRQDATNNAGEHGDPKPPAGELKTDEFQGTKVCSEQVLLEFSRKPQISVIKTLVEQKTGCKAFLESVAEMDAGGPTVLLVKVKDVKVDKLIEVIRGSFTDPAFGLVKVEPDYLVTGEVIPNDSFFKGQWGLHNTGARLGKCGDYNLPDKPGQNDADVDAPQAWDSKNGDWRPTVVAVLDTGINYEHVDLQSNIWSSDKEFQVEGLPEKCAKYSHGFDTFTNKCDPRDKGGHGTLVSGVIGATWNNGKGVAGISPRVQLMGIKVLDGPEAVGCINNVIKALTFLRYVKRNGIADVRVLNNSYGCRIHSSCSSPSCPIHLDILREQIRLAGTEGMLFVAAAGNGGYNNDCRNVSDPDCHAFFPANFTDLPNVISVAATTYEDKMSHLSSSGKKSVHLGAPGDSICSTSLSSGAYVQASGTSMAAPFVSGAASLLLSHPRCSANPEQLRGFILDGVEKIQTLKEKTIKGGRLNIYNSLLCCLGTCPPNDGRPLRRRRRH